MNADTQLVKVPSPGPQSRLLSYHNWIHLNPGDRAIVKRTGCAPELGTVDHLSLLALAGELRSRGTGLRVLNLGGGDVDTASPMGSRLFTIMAALAQMEHEIKRERVTDSI